jgi:chromosome partitioning protein
MAVTAKPYSVNMQGLGAMADSAEKTLSNVREMLFEPNPNKGTPVFTSAGVAGLIGVDRRRMHEYSTSGDFPQGVIPEGSNTKHFTLDETITYVEKLSKRPRRPSGQRGRIIATTVFKGGTSKTTTTLSLAQGLSLNYGRRVLVIDADPQGSLCTYMGLQPELTVEDEQTIMPYIFGDEPDLRYAVQKSYWANIDIIPGNYYLYEADFLLPVKHFQSQRKDQFWNVMKHGLHDIAKDYDVVIIDTPPAMNYLTISMIYAADILIQPVPPKSVDFASASAFWRLLYRLFSQFSKHDPEIASKVYDYIAVLPSRVKAKDTSDMIVGFMGSAFGGNLVNNKIPESSALDQLSFMMHTIYDSYRPTQNVEDHKRYKERMDELVDFVDRRLMAEWGVTLPKEEAEK